MQAIVAVKRDDQFAPPGWDENRDKREDIIFYKYTGKISEYSTPEAFKKAVPASDDYDAAKDFRDNNI